MLLKHIIIKLSIKAIYKTIKSFINMLVFYKNFTFNNLIIIFFSIYY